MNGIEAVPVPPSPGWHRRRRRRFAGFGVITEWQAIAGTCVVPPFQNNDWLALLPATERET